MNQNVVSSPRNVLYPSVGGNLEWNSVGALALQKSLKAGDLVSAISLIESLDGHEASNVLRGAGFPVPKEMRQLDGVSLLPEIQRDLTEAAALGINGFELKQWRIEQALIDPDFAAKHFGSDLSFSIPDGFAGDIAAAKVIQATLKADSVEISLLGKDGYEGRMSLMFIAGQGLQMGKQGFGFDGIEGKYKVPFSMAQMVSLNRDAAIAVAEESTRASLGEWVERKPVSELSEWVPDNIQRVLRGTLSLPAASAVVSALETGAISKHAGNIGTHTFSRLLAEQGFDVEAPTVERQALDQGLSIINPDTRRGQYVGPVAGMDHRACLIKYSRDKAVELPYNSIPNVVTKPTAGDTVRIKYKNGDMSVSVAERSTGISR